MSVIFDNVTLITDAQGVYTFSPGARQRVWQVTPLIRTDGEAAKRMGIAGADHQVELTFLHVLPASVDNIISGITNVATRDDSGKLEVTNGGSYNNCICTAVSPFTIERESINITPLNPVGQNAFTMRVSLTFRQLR